MAANGSLTITIERDGGTARLLVSGEVGDDSAGALRAAAGRIHPSHDRIVIDLSAVTFIDIYGFDHVLTTRDALEAMDCRVVLDTAGMTELMLEVLQASDV